MTACGNGDLGILGPVDRPSVSSALQIRQAFCGQIDVHKHV